MTDPVIVATPWIVERCRSQTNRRWARARQRWTGPFPRYHLRGEICPTDAIVLLKADHKEIESVFAKFEAAGENPVKAKGQLVKKMIELLTVHTYLENELIYPEVRRLLPDLEDDVLESYEEHHVADVLCMELAVLSPDAERFDAKTTVLIENVTHHIDEEEQDWFPKARPSPRR